MEEKNSKGNERGSRGGREKSEVVRERGKEKEIVSVGGCGEDTLRSYVRENRVRKGCQCV